MVTTPPGVRYGRGMSGSRRRSTMWLSHHEDVAQCRTEDRHVQQHRAVTGQRQAEADDAGHDQRERRRLAGVRDRQRRGQVAGARQGEQLARVGVDDREEARDEPGETDVVDQPSRPAVLAECLDERVGRRTASRPAPPAPVVRTSTTCTSRAARSSRR